MKIKFLVAAGALAALAGGASAQILFNNGPVSTGPTAGNGTPAPAGTTWSECPNDGAGNANTNAGYGNQLLATINNRTADDFTVPSGRTWVITAVDTLGYQTGGNATASTFTNLNVRIWNGRPGDAGATIVYNGTGLSSSTFANIYRIFSTTTPPPGSATSLIRPLYRNVHVLTAPLTLTAGTYWVDWQTDGSLASGPWVPSVTFVNTRFPNLTSTPGNARQFLGSSGNIWQDALDLGNPGTAPDIQMEFPFILRGTESSPCRPDLNNDGELTFDDIQLFVQLYNANDNRADFNNDGEWTFDDIQLFVQLFNAGC